MGVSALLSRHYAPQGRHRHANVSRPARVTPGKAYRAQKREIGTSACTLSRSHRSSHLPR